MNGYYISASCLIKGHTYLYGFSVRAADDKEAKQKVMVKFDKYMRKWFEEEIKQEKDFKIETVIHEKHSL